jgi:protein-tyrosine phosphatase
MILGRRTEGIAILGTHVMKPRGLVGLGLDSLDVCKQEVRQVFDVLADPSNYPILIHCTQGKDRTGLVIQLVLFLLEVPVRAVDADYLMTDKELQSEREERLREIRSIGLDDSFAGCDKHMVDSIYTYLLENGGVEAYLDSCGVNQDCRKRVKEILRP